MLESAHSSPALCRLPAPRCGPTGPRHRRPTSDVLRFVRGPAARRASPLARFDAAPARFHDRAGIGRRELPPLFPRVARSALRARARRGDADRDGRAAAAGGLPPFRARREAARGQPACTRPACSRRTCERGFLLLTDLGSTTYARALDDANAHALYRDAIDALIRWQGATREGELPALRRGAAAARARCCSRTGTSPGTSATTPAPAERATLDAAFAA